MFKNRTSIDKKKALLARKEQILLDLQYYETRIPEYIAKTKREYCCSSDSEDDTPFPPFTLNVGPSFGELKQQERVLRTCLQATQELSGVAVLQSEVNVLVQDPLIKGEKLISEPGVWREVMAECRIDSVPFSITFYTHQPSRKFAPTYYRGLRILPVKKTQEAELANSVLSGLTRPSDAIEVLRSYATALRSRRNTLARLADKYTNKLLLERLPDGGFMLKCVNLLSMSWTLENKHSAVAAFHHKMCFDLEYMDESYLKKIKSEHKKLADPSLETDERTLILSDIIIICLEAQTQVLDMYESMESDQESVKKADKTTLSEDIDDNEDIDRRKRDKEVMAPPKTIPKKAKPKGKENNDDNRKSVKRASENDGQNAKRAKIDAVGAGGKSITDMVKENEISERSKNKMKKTTDKEPINQKSKSVTNMVQGKEISEGSKNKAKKTTGKEHMNQKGNDEVVDKEQNNDKVDKEQKKQKAVDKKQMNKNGNDVVVNKEQINDKVDKEQKKQKAVDKKQMNQKKSDKVVDNPQTVEKGAEKSAKQSKVVTKNVEKDKNSDNSGKQKSNERIDKNNDKRTEKVQTQSKETDKSEKQKSNDVEKATDKVKAKNLKNTEKNTNKVDNQDAGSKHGKITKDNAKTQPKNAVDKDLNNIKVAKSDTKTKPAKNNVAQVKDNVEKDSNPKTVANIEKTTKNAQNDKVTEKNIPKNNPDLKTPKTVAQNTKITKTANITEKADKENKNNNQTTNTKSDKALTNKPKEKSNVVKALSTEKTKTLPKNDPKNIFQSKIDTKNKIADSKNKIVAAKNTVKPKMLLPNHRNSSGGVQKTVLKSSVSKNTQIPQKKLSPYIAALQNNPVRTSPRMMSKFKSSSATNIQTKVFKPSTNIPRLLKQTRPQSK